ncbi:TPA: hypothetical protein OMI13_004440 [Escherichia coli]|nr:hypothetical protein [Escherichia coli]HCQ8899863.1 hypothetical protein [Escherichia coli]HCQ9034700.1 hypothetical protein [Escherichia coli]
MSATESKAKTGRKFSRKSAKAQKAVLFTILARTVDVSVAMTLLIKHTIECAHDTIFRRIRQ